MLKKIASDCLVVVVTHDKEMGKKYADRYIQIEYGKIVSDELTESHNTSDFQKTVISDKDAAETKKLKLFFMRCSFSI